MKIKLSKQQWAEIGESAGWLQKNAQEYYDDNFGNWHDMDDEENQKFYKQVQRESVWKTCRRCGKKVKLRPDYDLCNSCADALERGGDDY